MATLADSLVSSSARRLTLRKRPDLSARRHRYQGRSYWVVKEPVGLNYFRFQEEEFAILQMLDGQTSLDEIKSRFEADFPPQKISLQELQQFIGTLHRSGLVIADVHGQGHQLKKRRDERRRKELIGAATNILAVRFKGIDPERLLTWLHPKVRWFFSSTAVILCMALALTALLLVAVQFQVFQSKLPTFHQFFSPANAIWLAVALGVTKVLHEFGHGLSCKHFGGECHEMGVMILVLTPCLYCNVSDSWMLPNKWHRAAIGAAGMYVEIVIASIATFLWWFSVPGLFNHLCLSTMFVCSISTIMFNGNPLLRYDGYYILADVLEIPNLRQKASTILNRKLGDWFLGLEPPDDPFLPERNQALFALYTVASVLYRWVVVLSILFFLYKVFEPYGLQIIGQGIAAMALYGLLIQPLWKLGKFFWVPGRIYKVKKARFFLALGGLAVVVGLVVFLPLPHRVHCTLTLEGRDAIPVYVNVPGTLEQVSVRLGDSVDTDQQLARLTNLELILEIEQLKGKRAQLETRLKSLQQLEFNNPEAEAQIPAVQTALKSAGEQLEEKLRDRDRLVLKAPAGGIVLPGPFIPQPPKTDEQLPGWSGSPFEEKNLGATLISGVMFCRVGDSKRLEAMLVIDQADIDFIRDGQDIEILLDAMPGEPLWSRIEDIAEVDMKESPKQLSNKSGGDLATETDESGIERPISTSYQARAWLDNPDGLMRIGMRGQAKIHAGSLTIWQRFWRFVNQTFRFRM